ncbi:UDP-glucose 4-epimerase family protein [Shewanella sp. OMA3-2]|uniref:UDP-glucose 4-epimerase family protein n=1 Tax=Shewanella sp. OMA3-2 TaxID=2908650 RepID=UPI001F2B7C97|nr:SDR family oxidoreductase [Shewanella sp. OMA3-2]UJF23147.1 SDR family oxidoreductase [Shewanella sp. OMA3-2]
MSDNILITGATGFVGTTVSLALNELGYTITEIGRRFSGLNHKFFPVEFDDETEALNALVGIDIVVHMAARAHVMKDSTINPLQSYRLVNTYGTLKLARQAASFGVKRFIFISSIKVNGESTSLDKSFTADDVHHPQDAYGISKSEAETQLLALGQQTGMEIVIIRPPLVYGPGVKANFASLLNLASKGLPLPFACFNQNKRSMVSVDNLVNLIITCIEHPNAANQVFLVSDDEDLSTADLISRLSKACGKSGFMLPIPVSVFSICAKILRKKDFIDRLSGSLTVDISKTKTLLSWSPPLSVDEGFKKTADAFLLSKKND